MTDHDETAPFSVEAVRNLVSYHLRPGLHDLLKANDAVDTLRSQLPPEKDWLEGRGFLDPLTVWHASAVIGSPVSPSKSFHALCSAIRAAAKRGEIRGE